jgi:hypothetical protein
MGELTVTPQANLPTTIGVVHYPAASARDFANLPADRRAGVIAVLEACVAHRMSVRCEKANRDLVIVIGKGYASANHWLGVFRQA